MKITKKGFTNIILIVAVVILASALGYVTLVKKPAQVEQQQPTNLQNAQNKQNTSLTTAVGTGTTIQVGVTADWNTYKGFRGSYTIQYPNTVTLSKGTGDFGYPFTADKQFLIDGKIFKTQFEAGSYLESIYTTENQSPEVSFNGKGYSFIIFSPIQVNDFRVYSAGPGYGFGAQVPTREEGIMQVKIGTKVYSGKYTGLIFENSKDNIFNVSFIADKNIKITLQADSLSGLQNKEMLEILATFAAL